MDARFLKKANGAFKERSIALSPLYDLLDLLTLVVDPAIINSSRPP